MGSKLIRVAEAVEGGGLVSGRRSGDQDPAELTGRRDEASELGRADEAGAGSGAAQECEANCPCRLLTAAARGQSTASLEAALAASAERDPGRLAWALARFRAVQGLDPAGLAAWLGCREAELPRLALRRRPRAAEERAELARRFDLDLARLTELLERV